ncbi:hypothetical protein NUW54_g5327 [Trametes sanguinea]|uniref:Uncharacterized protein n=1 Tax=Trametes sanguinea TaxID=158606 RepID=A0ACC1PVF7_9APHY|nr:hypothetical protein NUW54_g5327 [Trametes sanguinea]
MSNRPIQTTPPRMRHVSSSVSASPNPGVDILRRELRETMLNKLLCLPYDDWMKEFLPSQDNDAQLSDKTFDGLFDGVPLKGKEDKMYDPFVEAVNGAGILGDFVLAKTYSKPDPTDEDGLKVDGGMYPPDSPAVTEGRTDWASVEVFIEPAFHSPKQGVRLWVKS